MGSLRSPVSVRYAALGSNPSCLCLFVGSNPRTIGMIISAGQAPLK
jgi:hypothetical protein